MFEEIVLHFGIFPFDKHQLSCGLRWVLLRVLLLLSMRRTSTGETAAAGTASRERSPHQCLASDASSLAREAQPGGFARGV